MTQILETSINPQHSQKHIACGQIKADVDILLAPLLLLLWKRGIRTCSSCQENQPGIVWIQFPEYLDAKRFFDAVSEHVSFLDWAKDFVYDSELSDFDGEGCFSIRFDMDDLKIVVKAIRQDDSLELKQKKAKL